MTRSWVFCWIRVRWHCSVQRKRMWLILTCRASIRGCLRNCNPLDGSGMLERYRVHCVLGFLTSRLFLARLHQGFSPGQQSLQLNENASVIIIFLRLQIHELIKTVSEETNIAEVHLKVSSTPFLVPPTLTRTYNIRYLTNTRLILVCLHWKRVG